MLYVDNVVTRYVDLIHVVIIQALPTTRLVSEFVVHIRVYSNIDAPDVDMEWRIIESRGSDKSAGSSR